jgi:small subunit ribosomal protein S6
MGREGLGTVTTYEILLMLDPEHAEARQDEIVARTRELVEKGGGTWQSHDPWGRRRLAYPIDHKDEGVYHLVVFDAEPATLDEVSRVLKIDDAVIRHLATRHVAGSRTSAPRDDAAAVPAAPAPETEAEAEAETEAEAAPVEPEPDESPAAEAPADEAEPDVSAVEEPEYAATDEEPGEVPEEKPEEKEE